MKYFCIIKEKIAYKECIIQCSMFHSFYLFLSILLCNVDSASVSDSNAYIRVSNCIQMFKFYSNLYFIWRFKSSNGMLSMASISMMGKLIFSKLITKVENLSQMLYSRFGQPTDNNGMFCFINILSFLCCWYLVEKKSYERGKEFLYFYSNPF